MRVDVSSYNRFRNARAPVEAGSIHTVLGVRGCNESRICSEGGLNRTDFFVLSLSSSIFVFPRDHLLSSTKPLSAIYLNHPPRLAQGHYRVIGRGISAAE